MGIIIVITSTVEIIRLSVFLVTPSGTKNLTKIQATVHMHNITAVLLIKFMHHSPLLKLLQY